MRPTQLLLPSKLVASALLVASVAFGVGSLMIGVWNNGMPKAGTTSLVASALLLPVSIALLLKTPSDEDAQAKFETVPFLVGIGFACYGAGLAYLGLVVPTFVFLTVWIRLLYRRSWHATLLGASGITLALYLLFIRVFGVPMKSLPF